MSYALPFNRGTTWLSTAQGAVPSGILGKVYFDPRDGNELMVVKNTDASALAGCTGVKWETAANFEVDKFLASGDVGACGIVDPAYSDKGLTVAVNAAFVIVRRGRTKALAGAVVSDGSPIVTDSAASNGVEGRFQNGLTAASAAAVGTQCAQYCGQWRASGNAGTSVLCDALFT